MGWPAGLFVPILVAGAAFGRCFAELADLSGVVSPSYGSYAVIGAAGLAAGVTQSVSVTVILMEMTADMR